MRWLNLKRAVREQLNPDGRTGRVRFCLLILLGTAAAALNLVESIWFVYFYGMQNIYNHSSNLFWIWAKIGFAATCLLAQIPIIALIWRLAFLSAVRRLNDIGWNRRLSRLLFVPAANAALVLVLAVVPGKAEAKVDNESHSS